MKKVIILLLILGLYACDQTVETPAQTVVENTQANTGVVLETISVESYTYSRLDMGGNEIWIASTPIQASVGDTVRFSGDMLMKDFHSKELDRTFSEVLFVNAAQPVAGGASNTVAAHTVAPQVNDPHQGMNIQPKTNTGSASDEPISVQALEGGMTIASIFEEYEQLEGQEVSLRAKVTKFSPNILGSNWITLQDGTGTAPDNSLVVTTSETVEIGVELIVKGRVKSNVDIGAGYSYKVLLEEASFIQ